MNGTGSQPDVGLDMYTPTRKAIRAFLRPLSALLLALVVFQGCKALNRLCGSARGRVPIIGSVSANTITFAEVQQGFLLSATGSQFVPSRGFQTLSSSWNATPVTYWCECRSLT